ncbi:hypothetical protein LTR84_010618 [Exophiala bonariae]|uniref:CCAAT-binding factor domain-containing protein n=1 Tax=Exophiala bonariae TaxID=1690606 RepID=A0AAV9MT88_9EURO|nr:hypothetical protein LTR84_010618 [Exophiala bonariae]
MSKSKSSGHGASNVAIKDSKPNTANNPTDVPSNDSFKDLRSKIQAQFQTLSQKGATYKSRDSKDKPQEKKQGKNKEDRTGPERGKKRDRNGEVLKQSGSTTTRPSKTTVQDVVPEGVDEEFFKEVQALGGTTEDLDLLADADSDSEVEGLLDEPSKTAGSGDHAALGKGMNNILKEIALAQGELEDEESTSDESEVEVEESIVQAKMTSAKTPIEEDTRRSAKKGRELQPTYVCEPKPDWFEVEPPHVNLEKTLRGSLSPAIVTELYEHAKHLLDEENRKFKSAQQSSSQSFYNTVITSGTLSDKISALTLAVQESPIHNVRALESLIGLARKRSRSQAVDVLRSLKDLLAQGSLLPESRKLQTFASQPTLPFLFNRTQTWKRGDKLPRGLKEHHLVVWAYENWLKEQYFEILKILEVWCNDEIEFSKSKAVSFVYELLKERPEQESNLLRLLVNKLGDPIKKIASQASYLLMQLLITHPAMKSVVVSAVETDFIFRPGQSLHGKYYAVVTLNQTALSGKEEEVASKLLDIYFGLFTSLLKNTETNLVPVPEKAEPETGPAGNPRRRRNKKPKATVQPQAEELREKLISAILTGVNRAYPYAESKEKSFSDHLETLFKVTHSSNFNTSIQAMLLIQQVSATHKASNDRFYRVLYESLLDPRLLVASKQQLYLNLLHRALKADLNVKRVKAFIKRLFQVLSLHDASFVVGAFFLLQDLEKTFPSLAGLIDQAEDHDDDEEVFRDVEEDGTQAPNVSDSNIQASLYDGHKRAPEYANADNSCVWELLPFLAHFHPAVSLSADHALRHAKLPGKPDLTLHTLSHFLDRFVYRNPKLGVSGLRGSSIMQPMAASDSQNVLIPGTFAAQRRLPVNSEAFRVKKDGDIAAEDVFFHKYFSSLGDASSKKSKEKKKKHDSDDNEGSEDEDEIWKAMMQSAPADIEGDEDSEDDLDLSELEAEMDGSDADDAEGQEQDDDDDEGVDIDPALFDESEDDLMDIGEAPALASEDSDFAGFDSAEEEGPAAKKAKMKSDKKKEKAKKKALPLFASVEDYAKMLEDDENEDK